MRLGFYIVTSVAIVVYLILLQFECTAYFCAFMGIFATGYAFLCVVWATYVYIVERIGELIRNRRSNRKGK